MSYEFKSIYLDNPIVANRSLDIFMPDKISRDVALFFVHGGGWFGGSKTDYHSIMRGFNKAGFICASVDYRRNGEKLDICNQISDIRHGYDCFTGVLKEHGQPVKIFVIGASAGAHLGGLLSLALPGECGESAEFNGFMRQHEWIKPIGCALQSAPILFEPWQDIFPPIWDSMQRIVNKPYDENKELYRKFALNTYLNNSSCPVFHLAAANEHMFPIEHAKEFIQTLNSLGVKGEFKVYANVEHGFFYDLTRAQQREAFQDIINFIDSLI
jgi:acetyl esterase/lipase